MERPQELSLIQALPDCRLALEAASLLPLLVALDCRLALVEVLYGQFDQSVLEVLYGQFDQSVLEVLYVQSDLSVLEVLCDQSGLSSEGADYLEVEQESHQPPKPLQSGWVEQESHQPPTLLQSGREEMLYD